MTQSSFLNTIVFLSLYISIQRTICIDYFFVYDQTLNWADANAYCQTNCGSELATIYDDEAALELLDLIDTYSPDPPSAWIGLNDLETERMWGYADGSTCENPYGDGNCIYLEYWRHKQPDNRNTQDCALLSTRDWESYGLTSLLDDSKCANLIRFICNPGTCVMPSMAPTQMTQYPTMYPTLEPTNPTATPTDAPTSYTEYPTTDPTLEPTEPSYNPTTTPSDAPTSHPTLQPSYNPTTTPTESPTQMTQYPTTYPTLEPTNPTATPTDAPTSSTQYPTRYPTLEPSYNPTTTPSESPTQYPTTYPTLEPSYNPTTMPSDAPTSFPTLKPSYNPTTMPSDEPTWYPTLEPSYNPTTTPSDAPTMFPTLEPSYHPTTMPSDAPTSFPTFEPSYHPTTMPSDEPTSFPTLEPSYNPTTTPSDGPTSYPTLQPTLPSRVPTITTQSPTRPLASNYTIFIGLNCDDDDDSDCSVDREALKQHILDAIAGDVVIFRLEIINDEVVISLSITTVSGQVLPREDIKRDIEREIEGNPHLSEVEVEEKDDVSEDSDDDAQKQSESDSLVAGEIVAVTCAILVFCGVLCLIVWKKRQKRNIVKNAVELAKYQQSATTGTADTGKEELPSTEDAPQNPITTEEIIKDCENENEDSTDSKTENDSMYERIGPQYSEPIPGSNAGGDCERIQRRDSELMYSNNAGGDTGTTGGHTTGGDTAGGTDAPAQASYDADANNEGEGGVEGIANAGNHDALSEMKQWFNTAVNLKSDNERYFRIFIDFGYDDMSLVKEITETELNKMGITKMAHQNRILSAIRDI